MFSPNNSAPKAGGRSQVQPGTIPDGEVFDFSSEDTHFKKARQNMVSNIRLSEMLSRGWLIENQYHWACNQKILIYLFHPGSGVSARLEPDGTLIFIHENGHDMAAPHENIWFQWILSRLSRVPVRMKLQMAFDDVFVRAPAIILVVLNLFLLILLSLR